MNIFSVLSLLAFTIYLHVGINVYNKNRASILNRMFLALCFSMCVWSFSFIFIYPGGPAADSWMKLAAFGWCTFSAIVLQIVLKLTGNRQIHRPAVLLLLYLPAVIFLGLALFCFQPDRLTPLWLVRFFYVGDFLYNFFYLLASIVLIYRWGWRSNSRRQRRQARIIVVTAVLPFLIDLLVHTVMPLLQQKPVPVQLGQIYFLISLLGIYFASVKYSLFAIFPDMVGEEILAEMMDLVIIISPSGQILKVNKRLEQLLGYQPGELLEQEFLAVIDQPELLAEITSLSKSTGVHRRSDLNCRKKDGQMLPVSISCSPIYGKGEVDLLAVLIVGQDITLTKQLEYEIKEHQDALEYIDFLAYHDSLTGLPNRKYFDERLLQELKRARRKEEHFAVLFMDVDNFKQINDLFGHAAGDQVLQEIGRKIKNVLRSTDFLARMGGDEFTLLIFDIHEREELWEIIDKIAEAGQMTMQRQGITMAIQTSIGSSIFPDDGDDQASLLQKADQAMYRQKRDRQLA